MDANSLNNPLLLSDEVEPDYVKKSTFLVSSVKWTLKIVMWVILIAWVGLIFLYPGEIGNQLAEKIIQATKGSVFGIAGLFVNSFFFFLIVCFVIISFSRFNIVFQEVYSWHSVLQFFSLHSLL